MVHHDRVRRFVQETPEEVPRWVHDAIASFARRAAAVDQVHDGRQAADVRDQVSTAAVSCVWCKQPRIDIHGLIRILDHDKRCHLCHVQSTVYGTRSGDGVDDVTDHDLRHC